MASTASGRHCPVCLGSAPLPTHLPASRPRIAAARRHLRCQASKDGQSRNFFDQAIQWGAALVRNGLDRQAATLQRLTAGQLSLEDPPASTAAASADPAQQRSAYRPAPQDEDGEQEEDHFRLLPRVLGPPDLQDSFADWEQFYLSMDHAGSWHRVFLNLLHEAVEAENFQEAAVFRDYTTRMESVDLLGEALDALDVALDEEDYGAASLVRDNAGLQYRGWWLGTSSAHNEPHLLRVESCFGRMAGFRLSISDIVQVEAQRKGSLVHTIGMLGQETRTGTNVMFANPHDEAEELCLGSVGAPVMEVWPVRPGELTATVLDSPEEEESSSSGWTSTVITTEGSPEDGGASEVQDSAEGAEVMQELVTQLEGLVEGLHSMQSSDTDGSPDQPAVLRIQFEETDSGIRLSPAASDPSESPQQGTPAAASRSEAAEATGRAAAEGTASLASSRELQAEEAAGSRDAEQGGDDSAGPSGRDDDDVPGSYTMYEVISNVPGGDDSGVDSYQEAMQALHGRLEDLPAYMEGDSHMFSRRPAAVFPVNRDRFVLNVLDRDDMGEDGEEEGRWEVEDSRGVVGPGLGSLGSMQLDDRVQVLPEGTLEVDADIQGKVDMILGLLDQTGRKVNPGFRGKLEAFLRHATILQASAVTEPPGLQGSVSYTRLQAEDSNKDPFTGLFLAIRDEQPNSNTLMPCLLRLERARNAAGQDSVTATKLLGVDVMPSNMVVFRAEISKQARLGVGSMLMEDLGVTARYAAQVRWGQDQVPASSQWRQGELLTFSSSAFHQAELGLCTTSMSDHQNIVWLSRINLPAVE